MITFQIKQGVDKFVYNTLIKLGSGKLVSKYSSELGVECRDEKQFMNISEFLYHNKVPYSVKFD